MILRAYGVSFFVTFFGTALSVLLTRAGLPDGKEILPRKDVLAFFVFFTMLFNGGIVPSISCGHRSSASRIRFGR